MSSNATFIIEVEKLLSALERFARLFEDFTKEWKLSNMQSLVEICGDARVEIQINEPKLLRCTTHCVVFGSVSVGKSALINALLAKPLLPSLNGPTTNSFVEIKKSDDDKNYIIFSDNPTERANMSSISRVDETTKNAPPLNSHVTIHYSAKICPILQNNFILIDTPGIDSSKMIDSLIEKECKETDIIILVISARGDFSQTEKNFLIKHKTVFSNFNLIIVLNIWDEIEESAREHHRNRFTDEFNNYFNELGVQKDSDNERIFFLSAKERLLNESEKQIITTNGCKERNERFDEFERYLTTHKERKVKQNYFKVLNTTFNLLKSSRSNITEWTDTEFQAALFQLKDIKENVNSEIISSFNAMYDTFFLNALEVVSRNESAKESELEMKLGQLIDEFMIVMIESLKVIIKDMLNLKEKMYILKMFETIFFQFYLKINSSTLRSEIETLRETIKKIIAIVLKYKIIAVVGASAGGAAVLAACGVGIGIVAPVATAIAAPTIGVAAGLAGGGLSGTITGLTNNIKKWKGKVFRPRYKDEEDNIKLFFDKMRDSLMESYELFLSEWLTLEKDYNELKRQMDTFNGKWK